MILPVLPLLHPYQPDGRSRRQSHTSCRVLRWLHDICHIQFWNMVIMEKEKRYVASISGGKDSMAMVLGLMEKGWPLTHCVYFDTGMEFSCIRKNIEKVRLELEQYGCELVILQPERHFLEEMLLRRIKCRDGSSHYL